MTRDVGLVNILCNNELIVAQVVDREQNLYKSLNATMGDVNPLDIIEAKKNKSGILEFVTVVEEGIPHKKIFYFKSQDDWRSVVLAANEHAGQCILQGLAQPRGTQLGVFIVAYEEGFDPDKVFGESAEALAEDDV